MEHLILILIFTKIETVTSSDNAEITDIRKYTIPSTQYDKSNELAFLCLETTPLYRNQVCWRRCMSWNGYYIASSQKLICFQNMTPAVMISTPEDPCECGVITHKGNSVGCDPKLSFDDIVNNPEECEMECSKRTVLRRKKDYVSSMEIVWCGLLTKPNRMIEGLEWNKKENSESKTGYDCVCGVGVSSQKLASQSRNENQINEDNTSIVNDIIKKRKKWIEDASENVRNICKPRINDGPSKLAATCSMGPFKTSSKKICQNSCNKAKAYFLLDGLRNELVCFHYVKLGEKIPSFTEIDNILIRIDDSKCDCGWKSVDYSKSKLADLLARRVPLNGTIHSCIPQLKHDLGNNENAEKTCRKTCKNHDVYIFEAYPKSKLSRCEVRTFSPTIYETLDWNIGNSSPKAGTKNGYEYTCECGLSNASLIIMNAKNNNATNNNGCSSSTRVNDKSHSDLTTNSFPILQNTMHFNDDVIEELFGDLHIPSPFSQNELDNILGDPDSSQENRTPKVNIGVEFESIEPILEDADSFQENHTLKVNIGVEINPIEPTRNITGNEYACPFPTWNMGDQENIVLPPQFDQNQVECYERTRTTTIENDRGSLVYGPRSRNDNNEGKNHVTRDVQHDDELSYLLKNPTENVTMDDLFGHAYAAADYSTEPVGDFDISFLF